jgi:hypothetical protein
MSHLVANASRSDQAAAHFECCKSAEIAPDSAISPQHGTAAATGDPKNRSDHRAPGPEASEEIAPNLSLDRTREDSATLGYGGGGDPIW